VRIKPHPIRLFWDSGAFSAWRQNKPFPVEDYIEFVQRYPEAAGCVSLDVIPGQPGKRPSRSEVDEAARQSWRNYRKMRKAGLDPMPVFHMGEDRSWLDRYLDAGATYIGLGGVAKVTDSVRVSWLNSTFSYLCGGTGWPAVKVHGFGVTTVDLIHRFPWATTDSMSWALHGTYGFAIVPRFKPDGEPDYNKNPYWVGFSRGSRKGLVHTSHLKGIHYDVMGPSTRKYVDAYLEQEGFTADRLHEHWIARTRLSLRFYKRVVSCHEIRPFRPSGGGLCTPVATGTRGGKKPDWKFKMLFTENTAYAQSKILWDERIDDRLMSYFYFRTRLPLEPESYMRTGVMRDGMPDVVARA
jgi:hypothetical protein